MYIKQGDGVNASAIPSELSGSKSVTKNNTDYKMPDIDERTGTQMSFEDKDHAIGATMPGMSSQGTNSPVESKDNENEDFKKSWE